MRRTALLLTAAGIVFTVGSGHAQIRGDLIEKDLLGKPHTKRDPLDGSSS